MKMLALLSLVALASTVQGKAEAIFVPSIVGSWRVGAMMLAGSKAWGVNESVTRGGIEVAPNNFYLFRIHRDEKTKTVSTRVYQSTKADEFGLKDNYPEAMHMVAEFSAVVTQVINEGRKWWVFADGPNGRQEAEITWTEIKTPAPAAIGKGKLRVALYDDSGSAGKGVPNCTAQLGAVPDIEVTKLDGDGIRAGLSGYHVVIFSGGSGSRQASTIGLAGREQVRRFIEAGGGYVGICAGAYLACDGFSWSVHVLDAKTPSPLWERGHADLEIETTPAGQSLLGFPAKAKVIYHNGPILTPAKNDAIPDYEPLVFFRTEVSKTPKHAGLQINTPAMVRGSFGKGKVLISSPHPEQTDGMEHWIEKAVRAVAP
jgi:hypothetical protein